MPRPGAEPDRPGPAPAAERDSTTEGDEPPECESNPRAGPEPAPRRGWFRRRVRWMPPDAYEPDAGRVRAVRWLAFLLVLGVVASTMPAWGHVNLQTAPNWARIVLLLAALQAFYVVWMVTAPDWASVWVVMIVFLFTAALYGMATAIVIGAPPTRPLPLAIGDLRPFAARWCGAVLAFHLLAICLCGHTSATWRRACELEVARRLDAS